MSTLTYTGYDPETMSHRHDEFSRELMASSIAVIREDELDTVAISRLQNERTSAREEKYGRSLTTMHLVGMYRMLTRGRRFGAFASRRRMLHRELSAEEKQGLAEFTTSVSEGLGTDGAMGDGLEVRVFDECSVVDGLVMAGDLQRAVSEMTRNGLESSYQESLEDNRMIPLYVRSQWDHKNALAVDAMARGETWYNMRVVVSPCPLEAIDTAGASFIGSKGFVPKLKRGFVQLYLQTAEGIILTGSLSFDGTDKGKLLEIFNEQFGAQIPDGEVTDNWLRYALVGRLSEQQAKNFATKLAYQLSDPSYEKTTNTVDLTDKYGELINRAYADSYVHACESLASGWQTRNTRNVIQALYKDSSSYNAHYQSALKSMIRRKSFTREDAAVMHELLVYSTIEMVRSLHVGSGAGDSSAMSILSKDGADFNGALSGFGAQGASAGRGYQACGLEITPGDDDVQLSLDDALSSSVSGGYTFMNFGFDQLMKRRAVAEKLSSEKRKGHCLACRRENTTVYGCGLCSLCNKAWCDTYVYNGTGLTIEQVAKVTKSKPRKKSNKKSEQNLEKRL